MIDPRARYATINYDRLHRMAEVIFRMAMVRQHCFLKRLVEGPRR